MSSPPESIRSRASAIDLLVIFSAAAALAWWTWATWADPLIDWGERLYLSWRVSAGDVLYRDLAYFNGPLSIYLNAGLFKIFGVSQHVLWVANLVILAGIIVTLYALIRAISSRVAAVICGLLFVPIFAFGRYQFIGNFNYITPYTPEMTHGLALDLFAIYVLHKYQRRQTTTLAAAMGLALGLCFLTKAEVFVPGLFAILVGITLMIRPSVQARKTLLRHAIAFVMAASIPPAVSLVLLACAMPFHLALLGALGSWPWVFDGRILQMSFYRGGLGTDDTPAHLLRLMNWLLGYLAVFGTMGALTWHRDNRAGVRRIAPIAIALGAAFIAAIAFYVIAHAGVFRFEDLLSPLPMVMAMLLIASVLQLRRAGDPAARNALCLRITLLVFAGLMLMKMALAARVRDYGFVLAMPATLMLAEAIVGQIPKIITQRGGDGRLFAMVATGLCASVAIAHLQVSASNMPSETIELGIGGDAFRAPLLRGQDVQLAVRHAQRLVTGDQTLLVAPQGLMINYLARKRAPRRFINAMEPEIVSSGEETVLQSWQHDPPNYVILTRHDLSTTGFRLAEDDYGQTLRAWIEKNYEPVGAEPGTLSIEWLRKRR